MLAWMRLYIWVSDVCSGRFPPEDRLVILTRESDGNKKQILQITVKNMDESVAIRVMTSLAEERVLCSQGHLSLAFSSRSGHLSDSSVLR